MVRRTVPWSEEEIEFIKKNTKKMTNTVMAYALNRIYHEGENVRGKSHVMSLKYKLRIY